MSEIRIRDAAIEDAGRLGEIIVGATQYAYSCFLSAEFLAARSDPRESAQRMRDRWTENVIRLVAVNEAGEVLGFAREKRPCSVAEIDSEIDALYVDPKFSRAGAGATLVKAMAHRFLAQGARSMAINTLIDNKIGCAFYEKMGGQEGPYVTDDDFPSRWFLWPDLRSLSEMAN